MTSSAYRTGELERPWVISNEDDACKGGGDVGSLWNVCIDGFQIRRPAT